MMSARACLPACTGFGCGTGQGRCPLGHGRHTGHRRRHVREHIAASRMLADLRGETATRWRTRAWSLDWPLAGRPVARPQPRFLDLQERLAHREVVSNVPRHARARHVKASARIENEVLHLSLEDDGVGLAAKAAGEREGNGMRNTRRRLEQLGALTISSGEPSKCRNRRVPFDRRALSPCPGRPGLRYRGEIGGGRAPRQPGQGRKAAATTNHASRAVVRSPPFLSAFISLIPRKRGPRLFRVAAALR